MRLILKILATSIVALITIFVWICAFLLNTSAFIFGIAGTLVGIMGLVAFITSTPQNAIILLLIAFLISPMGLPVMAVWMLGKLQNVNDALRGFIKR